MATEKRTVRMSDDEFKRVVERYGSLAEAIRAAMKVTDGPTEKTGPIMPEVRAGGHVTKYMPGYPLNPRGGLTPNTWPYPRNVRLWEELLLPVGTIIGTDYIKPWPINPTLHERVKELFEPWAENGFVLLWGEPEPVTRQSPNRKMQASFFGDREVWCDFAGDCAAGIEYLKTNTQVIVPMVPDIVRFNEDKAYEELYNLYCKNYKVYYLSGKPRSID